MDNDKNKKLDLKKHIDDNVNLYTVFGILNALTIFSMSNLVNGSWVKSMQTVSFLILSVILWWTIKFNGTADKKTLLLSIYIFFVDMALLALIVLWAVQSKSARNFSLFFVGLIVYSHLIGNIILPILLEIKWFNKFYRGGLQFINVIIVFFFIVMLSVTTVKYVDKIIITLITAP